MNEAESIFARLLCDIMQISNRLRRWAVRDRLLDFLNQHTAEELCNQLWWLSQE